MTSTLHHPPVLLPHSLAARWRLGCWIVAASLALTFLYFAWWTLQVFDVPEPGFVTRHDLLFALLAGLWCLAEHLLWPAGIWLLTSPTPPSNPPESPRTFARYALRSLALANALTLVLFLSLLLILR